MSQVDDVFFCLFLIYFFVILPFQVFHLLNIQPLVIDKVLC
jgi:hypothetical protein